MRSPRLFWKVFGGYTLLSLLTVGAVVYFVTARQDARINHTIEQRLNSQSLLLGELFRPAFVDTAPSADLQPRLKQLAAESASRITLVRPDGVVVADSHELPARMENHATRPEIAQALATRGVGVSTRPSPTVAVGMLYVARAVNSEDGSRVLGVVRTAVALDAVRQEQVAVQRITLITAVVACTAGLLLAYWIVSRIARPIRSLTRAAQAITAGDYSYKIETPSQDEFRLLADAFSHMCRELAKRLDDSLRYGDQLATVLGGMEEGVVAIDKQNRVLFANKAARRLLDFNAENVVKLPLWELIRHPEVQRAVADAMGGAPDRTELELGGPDRRVLSLHITPLPGTPSSGLVLVFHDVTDLRRLERLRQEFVANVSHELKTPLTSIKAYAETLREGAIFDPEHNLMFVHRIEQQSERLYELILDLLSLARIESGQQPFDIVPLPLDVCLPEWVHLHGPAAEVKGVQLQLEADNEPREARADEEGLRQIVDNLLDNAIKYTPEGGSVIIRWFADGDFVVLEVVDSGIGIARADQERIFERFYRVDKARSRELGGTGLGLSIVKHLALSFGGSVSVRSQPGQGSTFVVRLQKA